MSEAKRISAMDMRDRLGEVLSRVQYAGERFIIERRGEPVAAVIAIEDLRRLEEEVEVQGDAEARKARQLAVLAKARALRERTLAERGGVPFPDSATELNRLREERDIKRLV
jgi:prevent-host-death family protein